MAEKELEILFEDNWLIVCRKPAGLAVETARLREADVVSRLRSLRARKGEPPEVFPVHRLDQPVEGVLLLAKDSKTAGALSKSLTTDQWKKEYRALVCGIPDERERTLCDWLKKERTGNRSVVVKEGTTQAKKAVLSYEVLESWPEKNVSELRVILKTGRHHQIRVQLSHAGYPLVGDAKYGGERTEAGASVKKRPLCLCACSLDFVHPRTGKSMHFSVTPAWKETCEL